MKSNFKRITASLAAIALAITSAPVISAETDDDLSKVTVLDTPADAESGEVEYDYKNATYTFSDDHRTCTARAYSVNSPESYKEVTIGTRRTVVSEGVESVKALFDYPFSPVEQVFEITEKAEVPAAEKKITVEEVTVEKEETPAETAPAAEETAPEETADDEQLRAIAAAEVAVPDPTVEVRTTTDITEKMQVTVTGNNQKGVHIIWSPTERAVEYVIALKNGREYNEIGRTTELYYDVNDLKNEHDYTFLIRPVFKNGEMTKVSRSGRKSIHLVYKPTVTSEVTDDMVILRWKAIEGVDQYKVFKVHNGKLRLIGETNKTKVMMKHLESDRYYVVKAFINGNWNVAHWGDAVFVEGTGVPAEESFTPDSTITDDYVNAGFVSDEVSGIPQYDPYSEEIVAANEEAAAEIGGEAEADTTISVDTSAADKAE